MSSLNRRLAGLARAASRMSLGLGHGPWCQSQERGQGAAPIPAPATGREALRLGLVG